MRLVNLILELFVRLLDYVQQKKLRKEAEDAQENPTQWFNDHFNGVQSDSEQPSTDKASDNSDEDRK